MMSPKRLWNLLNEPRNVTLLMILSYICMGLGGWYAHTSPSATLLGEWGEDVMQLWGWLMLAYSFFGLLGATIGWYWVERIGSWAGVFSMVMYGSVLFYLHGQDDTRTWGASAAIAMTCALFMATRIARTWGVSVDPSRGPGGRGLREYMRDVYSKLRGGINRVTSTRG